MNGSCFAEQLEGAVDAYDVAVVGGGPGGLAAATYARMRGLSVVLFEAESFGGQLVNLYPTKPVDNFPATDELPSGELARRLAHQADTFGAELAPFEPVEFVGHRDALFEVRTDKRQVLARTLILALGLGRFRPRKLGLQGEERFEGKGLVYGLPPLEGLLGNLVVVGGGDTAVDTGLMLECHTKANITLVHRRPLRAFGRSLERLADSCVNVIPNAEVIELRGAGRLEEIVVARGDESIQLPVDLLVVSIGQVPDLSGIEGWDLQTTSGPLPVTSAMETVMPGVFAVGDFAAYEGKVKMIATAVAEGSTAAASVQRYLKDGARSRPAAELVPVERQ
jgi:thioredoxin reductase